MNFIEGRLESARDGGLAFVAGGDRNLPLAGYDFSGRPEPGRPVALGVRPEHVTANGVGNWPGFRVEIVEPMGADNLVWCSDGAVELEVRLPGDQNVALGEPLALGVDPRRVSLFAADSGERL
jgi:multiple sugar transport system ATP-binding protein